MGYRFSSGVSGCVSQNRVILLDLNRDRYLQVGGSAGDALSSMLDDRKIAVEPDALSPLVAAGLLQWIDGAPDQLRAHVPVRPETSLLETAPLGGPAPAARLLAPAVLAVTRAAADVRLRGMAQAVARSTAAQPSLSPDPVPAARQIQIVTGFRGALRLMPRAPKCLIGSLALRSVLARAGIPSQLVIGVLGAPFRAHCWLQQGSTAINETVDAVGAFTPILVA